MSLDTAIAVVGDCVHPDVAFEKMLAIVCEATDGRDPSAVDVWSDSPGHKTTTLQQGLLAKVAIRSREDDDDLPPGTAFVLTLTTWGVGGRPCKGQMHAAMIQRFLGVADLHGSCMIHLDTEGTWITDRNAENVGLVWHNSDDHQTVCIPATSSWPFVEV